MSPPVARHPIAIAIALVTVVAVVGFGAYRFWLPSYRPSLEPGERFGIDVSHRRSSSLRP